MGKCCIKTKKGIVCKNTAKSNGMCGIHYRTKKKSSTKKTKKSPRTKKSPTKRKSSPKLEKIMSNTPIQPKIIRTLPPEKKIESQVRINFSQVACDTYDKRKYASSYKEHKLEIPNDEKYKEEFKNSVKNYLLKRLLTFPEYKIIHMGTFDSSSPIFTLNNVIVSTKGYSSVKEDALYSSISVPKDNPSLAKEKPISTIKYLFNVKQFTFVECVDINGKKVGIYPSMCEHIYDDEINKYKDKTYNRHWYMMHIKFYIENLTTQMTTQEFYKYLKDKTFDSFKEYFYLNFDTIEMGPPKEYTLKNDVVSFKLFGTEEDMMKLKRILSRGSLADAEWEGEPGSGFVIESKEHPGQEGGLINYLGNITYERL